MLSARARLDLVCRAIRVGPGCVNLRITGTSDGLGRGGGVIVDLVRTLELDSATAGLAPPKATSIRTSITVGTRAYPPVSDFLRNLVLFFIPALPLALFRLLDLVSTRFISFVPFPTTDGSAFFNFFQSRIRSGVHPLFFSHVGL